MNGFKSVLVVVMAVAVGGVGTAREAAAAERHEHKELSVAAGGTLTFVAVVGEVEVKTHDKAVVVLDSAVKSDAADAAEVLDRLGYEYQADHGDATVTLKWKDGRQPRNVNLSGCRHTLLVPAAYGVDVKTGAGDVTAVGVHGRVVAKTSGGRIRVSGVTGPVKADTSAGDVALESVKGAAEVVTSGGSITLAGVQGDVSARTSAGDIRVGQATGRLTAHSSGGSIRGTLAGGRDQPIELTTSAGDIRVTVADGFKADLTASTSAGEVRCDVPVQGTTKRQSVDGRVNGGGVKVTLRTSGGNVRIGKADASGPASRPAGA